MSFWDRFKAKRNEELQYSSDKEEMVSNGGIKHFERPRNSKGQFTSTKKKRC